LEVVEEPFEAAEPLRRVAPNLVLDLEGFEGPIDVLLTLARDQKVDLTRISILRLADQYLEFLQAARELRLEIAADYLVMAAWLAYLKSRLLLPPEETEEEEPSAPELAEALTFQLRRLEAMQNAGVRLMSRPQLGKDVFPRGAPEGVEIVRRPVYALSLYELLKTYGDHRRRLAWQTLTIEPSQVFDVASALKRLRGVVGGMTSWQSISAFLPTGLMSPMQRRSAIASTLVASLELARNGEIELRQMNRFGPIYLRRAPALRAAAVGHPPAMPRDEPA
jgi:segregation and condensation protein A